MKDFKIGQLTKVLVAERLRKFDDRCAAAVELFKQVLLVALKDAAPADPDWSRVARDAAAGTLTALLLCKLDLADGSAKLLAAAGEVACQLDLDLERMRESALRGVVDMRRFVSADELLRIRFTLEKHFPKAARRFADLLYTDVVETLHAPNG